MYEPVSFMKLFFEPCLEFEQKKEHVALHVPCTSKQAGLTDNFVSLAERCSKQVSLTGVCAGIGLVSSGAHSTRQKVGESLKSDCAARMTSTMEGATSLSLIHMCCCLLCRHPLLRHGGRPGTEVPRPDSCGLPARQPAAGCHRGLQQQQDV
jgi:hypothetical protein